MYLRASFHRSGVNSLRVRSALVLHKQIHIAATRLGWTAVILNSSARLVGHFQTVGHLKKCTVKMVYINLLKVKRRVRSNRLNPPPPTRLAYSIFLHYVCSACNGLEVWSGRYCGRGD